LKFVNMLPIWPKSNTHDIVAIGASAGGIEAILELISLLPEDLAAAVLVVLHRAPTRQSHLQSILSKKAHLTVAIPKERDRLDYGICLVGTPDQHLSIGPGLQVHLVPDHFYRSHNIDALFDSLARNAGSRTIGVVLSGLLKDGALGLKAIKEAGGIAFVQSIGEASYPDMPMNAIKHGGAIDLIAPVSKLASAIVKLTGRTALAATQLI
jgi:two-component system, chemotaxis family, protein-glutamate methylesterase/glutaminase